MPTQELPQFNGCAPPIDRRAEAAQQRCREALNEFLKDASDLVETAIMNCGNVEDMEIDEYELLASVRDYINILSK